MRDPAHERFYLTLSAVFMTIAGIGMFMAGSKGIACVDLLLALGLLHSAEATTT